MLHPYCCAPFELTIGAVWSGCPSSCVSTLSLRVTVPTFAAFPGVMSCPCFERAFLAFRLAEPFPRVICDRVCCSAVEVGEVFCCLRAICRGQPPNERQTPAGRHHCAICLTTTQARCPAPMWPSSLLLHLRRAQLEPLSQMQPRQDESIVSLSGEQIIWSYHGIAAD